jgi:two-component system invasion response regulator UvrY
MVCLTFERRWERYRCDVLDCTLKILIADDNERHRNNLKLLLADVATVVGEAASGHEALSKSLAYAWDAVLLDILMPDVNGIAVLRVLHMDRPTLPVILVSTYYDHFYVRGARRAGAAGYINKTAVSDELVPALRHVLAGGKYFSPTPIDGY